MKNFQIKKGHDLQITGKPEKVFKQVGIPDKLKIEPPNFYGIKPKLVVKEGQAVKLGTKLFFDKLHPGVHFTSPGSGTISKIAFGERRRVDEIVIELDKEESSEVFPSHRIEDLHTLTSDAITSNLLEAGLWPVLRRRPFSKIADPEQPPKSIFVSAMSTAPFAPDVEFLLADNNEGFQAGLTLLNKLTTGSVNLVMAGGCTNPELTNAQNVDHYSFTGPHPAGNVGIHIHYIDPIDTGESVWYVSMQDVQAVGQLFLSGRLPVEKTITIGGSAVADNYYVKIRRGMMISDILKDNVIAEDSRLISGDVLSGMKVGLESTVGYYDEILSVIPEGRERNFMGWIMPGLNRYSLSNTFLSKLKTAADQPLDTNLNGGRRAIIPFGRWEALLPMEIMPTFLIKSILARDIEEMEKLGIYECDPEDFALCEFACTSKQEVTQIIRTGLDYIEAEG